jgi:hypothetical protein
MLSKILGANWKTTVSGIGSALFAALTVLAALPDELGDISMIFPPEYKHYIVVAGLIGTTGLRIWSSLVQKDRNVTGGNTAQTLDGSVAAKGTATLVDITKQTTVDTAKSDSPKPN